MVYQTDERSRQRKHLIEQAIRLAMQSRWEEAVAANQAILEITGQRDGDALNRLGRAQMALGRLKEAQDSYGRALQLDPTNQIAKKNLAILGKKSDNEAETAAPREYVAPALFVEETGKTAVTTLQRPHKDTLSHMTPGERVHLRAEGTQLLATNAAGDVLGQIDPRIALRLSRRIEGGNQYAAAISQLGHETARIIIKETFQHPSQAGRLSFPPAGSNGAPRPYTRDGLLRYNDDEDEEVLEEIEPGEGWDTDGEAQDHGDVRLLDYQKTMERDDRDESVYDEE